MADLKIERYWQEFLATLPADSPYRGKPCAADKFGDKHRIGVDPRSSVVEW